MKIWLRKFGFIVSASVLGELSNSCPIELDVFDALVSFLIIFSL